MQIERATVEFPEAGSNYRMLERIDMCCATASSIGALTRYKDTNAKYQIGLGSLIVLHLRAKYVSRYSRRTRSSLRCNI